MRREQIKVDDAALAGAAARGDRDSLAALYEQYKRMVYTIAYKITLNEEDALDATQNVFARLVEKIGLYKGQGAFRSWLATLAAHEAMNLMRRPSRSRETATDPGILTAAIEEKNEQVGGNPQNNIETQEQRNLVESALRELSPQQRAIFTLRWREDISPKEIAERLGIPAGQVRTQLCFAISRIRTTLERGGFYPSTHYIRSG